MLARGWLPGRPDDFDRAHALDVPQLCAFLAAARPALVAPLGLDGSNDSARLKFLDRLQGQITTHGVVHVLRHGIQHGPHEVPLYAATPTPGNTKAEALFAANRWTVTRQLRYSLNETRRALDLCLFVNGLPLVTMELKNSLTKQTAADAVEQYRRDRAPRGELLFQMGRCIAHFAVDDAEARFCTELKGKDSWFLPFNRGHEGGAGNPPNPHGLRTDYLWKETFAPRSLADVIEHFAQVVERKDERTGRKTRTQVFPRYHQLDVVRAVLAEVRRQASQHPGEGRRYLIQHSAGSGKSNSIAWLAHQLSQAGEFDSVIVVTDRRILDRQTRDTVGGFTQVRANVGHAERSGDLRRFIEAGKTIIISTVQKFSTEVMKEIGDDHRDRTFAVIIDEAHSSQGGKTARAMSQAIAGQEEDEEETAEDVVIALAEARKLARNASYFAFTATPKNKTLELFGEEYSGDDDVKHRPFHSYTMKQAIEEGFILDVLKSYTPVQSYYHLVSCVPDDPEFDQARAQKKIKRYVEGHPHAVRIKAEIMVDHFLGQVMGRNKIGGEARGMVVCGSIERAIQYYHAIRDYLGELKSGVKAIVAFSGEHEWDGAKVTEASLNGFPSAAIAEQIRADPYRLLVCADKFQTGYDEPLLHTMYVDKPLSGIKAVQTLSRLNRAHPKKTDVFVLDFQNDAETIRASFADYYKTTILSGETDANKLHDLKSSLDGAGVYSQEDADEVVRRFLAGAPRDQLDPILDACKEVYRKSLDEDGQVKFKGQGKAFLRTYEFLGSVLPYVRADWERLSIFLNFLVEKLPAPVDEDLAKGVLDTIDMDTYRAEKKEAMTLALADEDAEIGPVPVGGPGGPPQPELDRLSNILKAFNDQFGGIPWSDADRVRRLLTVDLPRMVDADPAYQNAKKRRDAQNARVEHDSAVGRAMLGLINDDMEAFKQFSDNEAFRRWVVDASFALTYDAAPFDSSGDRGNG